MDNLDKELIRLMVAEELRKRQFGKTFWDKIERITFRILLFFGFVLSLFFILDIVIKAAHLL